MLNKVDGSVREIYAGILKHKDSVEQWPDGSDINVWTAGDGGFWVTLGQKRNSIINVRIILGWKLSERIGIGIINPCAIFGGSVGF